MSCRSSVAITVEVTAVVVMAVIMVLTVFMFMIMTVPRASMVRAIGPAFWLKGFFHGVHNQVH